MHEKSWKMKINWKRRCRIVLLVLEDKCPWEKLRENDKKIGLNLDRSKRERKCLWKVLNSEEHVKNLSFKKLSKWFSIDWKTGLIYRKLHSINPASIKHQSSQADSNQIFNRNFDRSRNRFYQSKIWKKKKKFEKQNILMQKLLKAQNCMNKMHEYEMKSFSKTLDFNPDLPKTKFSINLSSNFKL